MTTEYTATDTKLEVPYLSQYLDVSTPAYREISCGMTGVYMTLAHFGAILPSLDELIQKGIETGGYSDSGWRHEYFVSLFKEFGYTARREENMRDSAAESFREALRAGNPVIVSAVRHLFDQRFFHMVVLTGFREDAAGKLEGFFYHDPGLLKREGAAHRYVSLPTFLLDWRRMAIFPARI